MDIAKELDLTDKISRAKAAGQMADKVITTITESRDSAKQTEPAEVEKENPHPEDEATLSNQSRLKGLTEEQLESLLKLFSFEELEEAWNKLMNWYPNPQFSMIANLKELTDLYQLLLNGILSNTEGTEQANQLLKLENLITRTVQRLVKQFAGELSSFWQQYESEQTISKLQNSFYNRVTGRTLPPEEIRKAFSDGTIKQTMGNDSQGLIYKPDSQKRIITEKNSASTYARAFREGSSSLTETPHFQSSAGRLYKLGDIEKAEYFVHHLKESGGLLANPKFTSRSSELTGLLCAITNLKGQVFSEHSGVDSNMGVTMKNAVNNMIDSHITSGVTRNTRFVSSSDSNKQIYKVYYYVMSEYSRTKKPDESVQEGLKYANQAFHSKKEEQNGKETAARPEDWKVFFSNDKKDPWLSLKSGCQILEKDWMNFLAAIGQRQNRRISLNSLEQNLWRMSQKGSAPPFPNLPGKYMWLAAALTAAAIILAALLQ